MREYKTIYKARFILDVELTDQPFPHDKTDKEKTKYFDALAKVTIEKIFSDFNEKWPGSPKWVNHVKYVEKYFPEEIKRRFTLMLLIENLTSAFEDDADMFGGVRSYLIKFLSEQFVFDVRQRMKIRRGPKKQAEKSDRSEKKQQFIEEIHKKLEELHDSGENPSRSKAAGGVDGLRTFTRKLNRYEINFDELVKNFEATQNEKLDSD